MQQPDQLAFKHAECTRCHRVFGALEYAEAISHALANDCEAYVPMVEVVA